MARALDELLDLGGVASPGREPGEIAPAAPKSPRESADVVTADLKLDPPAADGTRAFSVTLTVEKPWHVYANPVGNDTLKASETRVEVVAGEKSVEAAVEYPKGTLAKDTTAGEYRIYEGTVKLTGKLGGGKTDGPLEVRVRVIACKEGVCLLPSVLKLTAK
jgi:hypothetical protein